MDLLDALNATATDKGPRSNLEKYLEEIGGDTRDKVIAELNGTRQAAHLARALTLMARDAGIIDKAATISGQSVTKWRDANGTR